MRPGALGRISADCGWISAIAHCRLPPVTKGTYSRPHSQRAGLCAMARNDICPELKGSPWARVIFTMAPHLGQGKFPAPAFFSQLVTVKRGHASAIASTIFDTIVSGLSEP